jgi:NAD(P)-dependent dehydrogenase (short-subunit alcohol dehydrogenase family)
VADALDGAQVAGAVDAVVRGHGRIDILVNDRRGQHHHRARAAAADELTLAEWHRVITFNPRRNVQFCRPVV